MKYSFNLLFLFSSLFSFGQNEQSIIVIDPDKTQSMSTDGLVEVFEMIDSEFTRKSDPDKPLDDVLYVFDLVNNTTEFFRFGELKSSLPIIKFEKKNGLIYVDCEDLNIRTGGRIVTHYVLNPSGKDGAPHMIYHFYWDDIDTTYAEVTLTLK